MPKVNYEDFTEEAEQSRYFYGKMLPTKYILHKYSSPGWTKEFDNEYDCRVELLKHICGECLRGDFTYVGEDELITENNPEDIPDIYDIESLLGTACGCEYGLEK